MTNLAMYERKEGKRSMPISRYFRTDYIGLALIKNFFWVTFGYGLILLVIGAYFNETLMGNIYKMDLVGAGMVLVAGYVILLVFYTILTYIVYSVKYHVAKKRTKKYYEELTKLNKIYSRDDNKSEGRTNSGGRRK